MKGLKEVTEEELWRYMAYYGDVEDVHIHEKENADDVRDFAFVLFKLASAAVRAARNTPHFVTGKNGNKCTIKAQLADPYKTIEHQKRRNKGWRK